MKEEIRALIDNKYPLVSNLANVSAYLNSVLDNINWVGFYLLEDNTLYLGPFQGEVACYQIPFGKGVCGEAVKKRKTIVVDDVLSYPNHIACSSKSRSEIVIPIIVDEEIKGVLDIDAPTFSRFNDEKLVKEFEEVVEELKVLWKK